MQIAFAGSPQFASWILDALIASPFKPSIVFTQPAKPSGRGLKSKPTPVYDLACTHQITTEAPPRLNECVSQLKELDLLAVAAYGQILSNEVLNAPKRGCINVHASLLPRWRGASPIEHAILTGDDKTGVSIMEIVPKLDAGPVYKSKSIPLLGSETTQSLTQTLAEIGSELLIEMLTSVQQGEMTEPTPQNPELVTYARRLTTEDARINWDQLATEIERQIRAFDGRNAAFTTRENLRLRIIDAEVVRGNYSNGQVHRNKSSVIIGCQDGGINLKYIQINIGSGKPMSIQAALNGYGDLFSDGSKFDETT